MRKFSGKVSLALCFALGVLVSTQGCSGKKEEGDAPAQGGASLSQAQVDQTVALAKQNLDKLRLNVVVSRETRMEIVGAKPSPVPGLVELKIKVSREDREAIRKLHVSPDLKNVVVGRVLHLGEVPRVRVEMENVDLKDAPMKGDPKAPVTLVEYSDFQCPFCRAAQRSITRIMQEYEGKVKLVYRHYPLGIHVWAARAAMLSECVRKQKPALFWKLHDFYYSNTQRLDRDNILAKTQEQVKADGVDIDKLNKCFLEQETAPLIKKSMDEGKKIGVRGTPVFLVNDVFLSGNQPYAVLNAIILEELGHDWSKDPAPQQAAAEETPAAPEEEKPTAGDEKPAAPMEEKSGAKGG